MDMIRGLGEQPCKQKRATYRREQLFTCQRCGEANTQFLTDGPQCDQTRCQCGCQVNQQERLTCTEHSQKAAITLVKYQQSVFAQYGEKYRK